MQAAFSFLGTTKWYQELKTFEDTHTNNIMSYAFTRKTIRIHPQTHILYIMHDDPLCMLRWLNITLQIDYKTILVVLGLPYEA